MMAAEVAVESTPVERLRSSRDVLATLRSQHRAGHLVVVHARPTGPSGPVRLTVVASRKVGSAVRRNRAKRLLREAVRSISWHAGQDVVLVARAATASSSRDAVAADLAAQVTRLGVGAPLRS